DEHVPELESMIKAEAKRLQDEAK
ncbi:hypothetical protein LCGC14_0800990, partial [marine sediment metagenome]